MTLLWLFILLWILGWALAQTVTPFAIEWLTRKPGHRQAQPRRILLVCALHWLVPLIATSAMASLAAAKKFGWVQDHCLFHAPHHPHFCFEHLPEMLAGHGHGHLVIAITILSIFGLLAVWRWYDRRQQRGRLSALTVLSRGKGLRRILEDPRLMAFAAGGKRPHIYLSQGLLDRLSRREQRMVVAHEAAHLRYRDLAAGRLMEVLLLMHFKPFAAQLRRLWRDAIEARADEQVAHRFGRTATAELLLQVAKHSQAAPVATGLGGGNLTTRIQALLEAESPRKTPLFEATITVGLLTLLAVFIANHHTLETLLGLVIRL